MSNYTLPLLGELDLTLLEEHYDADMELEGHRFRIDLNFEHESIAANRMEIVKKFLAELAELNAANLATIRSGLKTESSLDGPGVVRFYIEHHLEVMDKGELSKIILNDKKLSPEEQMLAKLHLVRVGLYPDKGTFAVFDYSIGPDLTQYLIVMNMNEKGALDSMTMES